MDRWRRRTQVDAVESVMEARLHAYGVGTFSSSASDDRITYEVPLPQGDATTVDALREVLGTTGAFSIALLGADPRGRRAPTSPPAARHWGRRHRRADRHRPERDAHARPDVRRRGGRGHRRRHPDARGRVPRDRARRGRDRRAGHQRARSSTGASQLSFATDDTTPARLAPILQSGPLPLPVEAVTP